MFDRFASVTYRGPRLDLRGLTGRFIEMDSKGWAIVDFHGQPNARCAAINLEKA